MRHPRNADDARTLMPKKRTRRPGRSRGGGPESARRAPKPWELRVAADDGALLQSLPARGGVVAVH